MTPFAPWRSPRLADAGRAGDLACRAAAGDRQALEALYRSEAGPVYRYVLALCGNPGWAADATQEAFVNFAQQTTAYDPARSAPGAYLAGMARHALLATLRRQQREEPLADSADDALPGSADQVAAPDQLLVQAQGTAALWAALRRLPWVFREAIVLVDLQERPYAEAAAVAGVEINTLRTRLHRGRLRLTALLGERSGALS